MFRNCHRKGYVYSFDSIENHANTNRPCVYLSLYRAGFNEADRLYLKNVIQTDPLDRVGVLYII